MTLTMARGKNKIFSDIYLLPIGSAQENINGLAHLFEHLLVNHIRDSLKRSLFGYTTEDYILIFCQGVDRGDFIKGLKSMKQVPGELLKEQNSVIREIEEKGAQPGEIFFREVWTGTRYEKSPQGTKESITDITFKDITDLKEYILENNIYSFSVTRGIYVSTSSSLISRQKEKLPANKSFRYRESNYIVHFASDHIKQWQIIEKILQLKNPTFHIQLSQKKEMAALVLEKGCNIPYDSELNFYFDRAVSALLEDFRLLEKKKVQLGVAELRNIYFYNQKWSDYVLLLPKVPKEAIKKKIETLRNHETDI